MTDIWLEKESLYSVITEVFRQSLIGGVVRRSDLSDERKGLYERGVEQEVLQKDEIVICNCSKYYSINETVDCPCGNAINESENPDIVQYYSDSYPDIIKRKWGTELGGFSIKYDTTGIDGLSIRDLEPSPSDKQFLHISPFFEFENESGIYAYPNCNDIFVDWSSLKEYFDDKETLLEEVQDFLERLDDCRQLARTDGGYSILQGGPNGPQSGSTMDTSWYTKLRRTSKKIADRQSLSRFKRTYHEQFERLGNEFLHIMFPHATTLQAGGSSEPDGYLLLDDRSYLVEAKCYSGKFKLFKEQDKSNRYVSNMAKLDEKPHIDFNLSGYIFIAHEFNESDIERDLRTMVESNFPDANLDIICINDLMMENAVEKLSDMYRHKPSSAYRICDRSERYRSILKWMSNLNYSSGMNEDDFNNVLKGIEGLTEEPSSVEKELTEGMKRESGFDKEMENILS